MVEENEIGVVSNRVAFAQLKADQFPVRLEYIQMRTGDIVLIQDVPSPGAVRVPGLAQKYGPIKVRAKLADGTIEEQWP